MKNKKMTKILVIIAVVIALGFGVYYFLTVEDGSTSLNLLERQWIEKNKKNLIDFSVVSNIPVISNNGDGVVIDFLNSLKEETELAFNMVSYKNGEEITNAYSIQSVDALEEDDILIYEDNYVIVTKDENKYFSVEDLVGLNIGVLNHELDSVNKYLTGNNVTFKTYNTVNEMVLGLQTEEELDGIVVLKTTNLNTILENDLNIAYGIDDYKKSIVIRLGEEERLNDILTKYYKNWSSKNYETSFGDNFIENYIDEEEITDSASVNFKSKRYVYGYVENGPYDTIFEGKLAGINNQFLQLFSSLTGAEIRYESYSNLDNLRTDFNTNKIDFYYNYGGDYSYSMDIVNTSAVYDNRMVILSDVDSVASYNTLASIKEISAVTDSSINAYLSTLGLSVTLFDNTEVLVEKKKDFIAIDINSFNYYKNDLSNYVVVDYVNIEDSSFTIRDITENEIFTELMVFYASFVDNSDIVNLGLDELLNINIVPYILRNTAIILGAVVGILLIVLLVLKVKPKPKMSFSKEDKIKYTDALTSLKNRNYLNDSIDRWDNSEIYPQSIIVVDLKNIAYINDNYGHAEGDNVIKQAASILIMNQLDNSEVMRTSGNEFLIYMVGHTEKQVVSHIKKLNKELKELKHGFGSAIGYSMINDGIKTIDDAINEASLDMRNNKEDTSE